jgi:molybdenum cofactor sulfurtransferase
MPLDFLEVVANVCYQFPKPRFIDPAIAYDAVKIRRLVEEATILAVRAASNIAMPRLANVSEDLQSSMLELAVRPGNGHNTKLSAERKFRMREQAIQKLARAYRLNEIACSVATAKHSASLEGLDELVLQRIPDDPDANYVHLFHEKIPTRRVAENTSLDSLDKIISVKPGEPENWRTRAVVKMMKGDYEGAAHDLTSALTTCQIYAPGHQSPFLIPNAPEEQPRSRVKLPESEQPSSLRGQLLFLRGWAYLCAASHQVRVALSMAGGDDLGQPTPTSTDPSLPQTNSDNLDAHKRVKALAKRSLTDIMALLAGLDYSPDLAMTTVREFSERTERIEYGFKRTRHTERTIASKPCKVYTVAELFAATPPSNLPPYPAPKDDTDPEDLEKTVEAVTAHPMLPEALHQLLLCHCLLQTSVKELQRHAYMVARLIRIIDGYPIFSPAASPARADWRQLTARLSQWVELSEHWDLLCFPEPLMSCPTARAAFERDRARLASRPKFEPGPQDLAMVKELEGKMGANAIRFGSVPIQGLYKVVHVDEPRDPATEPGKVYRKEPANDNDHKEFSERAYAIGEWILNAPMVKGTRRKKKKSGQSKSKALKAADEEQRPE